MTKIPMMKIWRVGSVILILFLLIACFTAGSAVAPSDLKYPKVLRFAALSPGSLLHALISGLSKVASDNSPMTVLVIPTAGTPTWLPMVSKQGTADMAIENFSAMWQLYTGKIAPEPIPKGFPERKPYPKTSNLRTLICGPALKAGMLVRKDTDMKYVADLKGKKIAWEWAAFPANTAITLSALLNGGLTIDDCKLMPVTEVVSAVRAVQEGRIDSTVCAVGMGAIAEADALVGVRFLHQSMDPDRVAAGQRAMPGCYTAIQPKGVPGVSEDTPLWAAPLAIVTATRLPEHVAYKLIETWWNHYQEYQTIHPLLRQWTPEVFTNVHVTLPFHEGSVRFFKEKGVWTPELEKRQQELLKAG